MNGGRPADLVRLLEPPFKTDDTLRVTVENPGGARFEFDRDQLLASPSQEAKRYREWLQDQQDGYT
jgi:hypothetical protein